MDLKTEEGIQNFRKSLNFVANDYAKQINCHKYMRADGKCNIHAAIMDNIDNIGYKTLQVMKANANNITTPEPAPTHTNKPEEQSWKKYMIGEDKGDGGHFLLG